MQYYNIEFSTREELDAILKEFGISEQFAETQIGSCFGMYGILKNSGFKKAYFYIGYDLASSVACCGALVLSNGICSVTTTPVRPYTVNGVGEHVYNKNAQISSLEEVKKSIILSFTSYEKIRGGIVLVDRSDGSGILVGMVRKWTSWPEFKDWSLEATASFNNPNHNSKLGLYLWRLPQGEARQELKEMA